MPLTSACERRSSTVPLRHSSAFFSLATAPAPAALSVLAEVDQALGGVGAAIEQHVLDQHLQLGLDLLVDLEHAGVDDAHVHAGGDGVIEKRRVHGLADFVVAAKAERDVGDAAADLGVRQVGLDPARGVDEVDGVVVVLLHAGGDGEDVGVEDDVFGREADLVDEDAVGALADADLVFVGGGLALLVEGHHDHGRAVLQHRGGVLAELLFAFLERDGVDDALALQALQAGFDDLPLGGVDHEGNLGDFGLAGQQLQEARHGGDAVDHALVHADVDDVGAVLDLLARDADGFFVLAFLDELGELGRAGDVGALADHDVDAGLLGEGLRAGEAERLGLHGWLMLVRSRSRCDLDRASLARRLAFERLGDGGDVLGRVAAAAAGDVDEAAAREVAEVAGHVGGAEIEAGLGERIGQAGVRVAGDGDVGFLRELVEERVHEVGAERAVEADGERLDVLHRVPEGFGGLRGDHGLAAAADGGGDHDGQLACRLRRRLRGWRPARPWR